MGLEKGNLKAETPMFTRSESDNGQSKDPHLRELNSREGKQAINKIQYLEGENVIFRWWYILWGNIEEG